MGNTMKINFLARVYAVAMSVLFASIATVGVAVLMNASGERARSDGTASAAARQSADPAKAELTQWKAPAVGSKQVL